MTPFRIAFFFSLCFLKISFGSEISNLNGKTYQQSNDRPPDLMSLVQGPILKIKGRVTRKLSKDPLLGSPGRNLIIQVIDTKGKAQIIHQTDSEGIFEVSIHRNDYKELSRIQFLQSEKVIGKLDLPRINNNEQIIDLKDIYLEY